MRVQHGVMKSAMKKFSLWLFLLFPVLIAHGTEGNGDELYLNDRLEPVKNKKQAYYVARLVGESQRGYTYQVFFLSGEMKMEGTYADKGMKMPNGEFTYYYQNGQVESSGLYREGMKYGIWQRYEPGGAARPERVYATGPMLKHVLAEAQ